MGLAPTASTTATLAMGDALAVALLQKRGFKQDDFAQFHPGGTLGRRLLVKVRDLMQHGNHLPRVRWDASGSDTILEMTSKKTRYDHRGEQAWSPLWYCHRRGLAPLYSSGRGLQSGDGGGVGQPASEDHQSR